MEGERGGEAGGGEGARWDQEPRAITSLRSLSLKYDSEIMPSFSKPASMKEILPAHERT